MNNTSIIKQAYIHGLAARGILRTRVMQKAAEDENPEITVDMSGKKVNILPVGTQRAIINDVLLSKDPEFQKSLTYKYLNSSLARDTGLPQYAIAGGIGAGVGGAIGALIQAARKKNILLGLGIGAGIGGGLGAGGKYINDKYIYPSIQGKHLEWGKTPEQNYKPTAEEPYNPEDDDSYED